MAGNLLCSPDALFRHIGLLFGERLDTLFTSSDSKIRIHPSTCYRIRCGFIFPTLEGGFTFFRMRVDGSCIRKEKVADSKISGYVWTGPEVNRHFLGNEYGDLSLIFFLLFELSYKFPCVKYMWTNSQCKTKNNRWKLKFSKQA